jgi:cation diffusion facilitator family transporter
VLAPAGRAPRAHRDQNDVRRRQGPVRRTVAAARRQAWRGRAHQSHLVARSMPASSKIALIGALVANLGIAATKFIVGSFTHSSVMIAEGIHSLVDTGNSGLMMFGRSRSRRAPDAEHPFGYGMELYFWSFAVATIVFGGGGGLSIYEGLHALAEPREVGAVWPNYLTIAVAAVFEGASLAIGLREFTRYRRERKYPGSILAAIRASKNPAMFLTVLEDSAALVGLAIAAAGVALRAWTGQAAFDGAASILIGLVQMTEALVLAVECRGLITGEPARPVVVEQIERAIAHHAGGIDVDAIRTLQLGPESILVFLDVRIRSARDAARLPELIARLIAELRAAIPAIHEVFVTLPRDEREQLATA